MFSKCCLWLAFTVAVYFNEGNGFIIIIIITIIIIIRNSVLLLLQSEVSA
jgi:hypothetical protein